MRALAFGPDEVLGESPQPSPVAAPLPPALRQPSQSAARQLPPLPGAAAATGSSAAQGAAAAPLRPSASSASARLSVDLRSHHRLDARFGSPASTEPKPDRMHTSIHSLGGHSAAFAHERHKSHLTGAEEMLNEVSTKLLRFRPYIKLIYKQTHSKEHRIGETIHYKHAAHADISFTDAPFTFEVPLEASSDMLDELLLTVWDKDMITSDNFVGVARLKLSRVRPKLDAETEATSRVTTWVKFSGRRAGALSFEIKFGPAESMATTIPVQITMVSASGLRVPEALVQPVTELGNAPDIFSTGLALGVLAIYLVVGAVFYSNVDCALRDCGENASVSEAVYFSVVTLTTVGYAMFGIGAASLSLGVLMHELSKRSARAKAAENIDIAKHLGIQQLFNHEQEHNQEIADHLEEQRLSICRLTCRFLTLRFLGETSRAVVKMVIVLLIGSFFYMVDARNDVDKGSTSYIDCLYFATITGTTIGYGDEYPTTTGGQIFAIFYLPIATVTLGGMLTQLAGIPFARREERMQQMVINQFGESLSAAELRLLCYATGGETCNRDQYVLAMLIKLGKVDQDDIDRVEQQFDKLDKTGDGILDLNDLSAAEQDDYRTGIGIGTIERTDPSHTEPSLRPQP